MTNADSPKMADDSLPPLLIAGDPALDFLNSLATPVDVPVEWLGSGEALVNWLRQAGLVSEGALRTLHSKAVPGEFDAVAGQARALREWFRGFVQKYRGKPLPPAALKELEPLNRILFRDGRFGQIVRSESKARGKKAPTLAWEEMRHWRSSESLLIPIAESMAKLVCIEDFTHVKACEGHTCVLLFIDRTRRHARRWCSMAICGNRAKQAAFRTRGRSEQ